MKKALLTASYVLCTLMAMAQTRSVTLTSERRSDKSVEIKYEKSNPGTYTVLLDFSRLENIRQPEKSYSINGLTGSVTRLEPIDKNRSIGYTYRYRSILGKLKPKIDDNFAYLLPYEPGTDVMVRESNFAHSTYFGSDTPEDWKAYRFYTEYQRSVVAVRKGIVVALETSQEDIDTEKVQYTSKNNYIIIEHPDGTLARYSGLKQGSIPVKIGQTIYPGDVLGENIPSSDLGHNVSIIFYYLKTDDFEANRNKTLKSSKTVHGFITPKFFTKAGIDYLQKNQRYTVDSNEEIKQKEMSKRELKNYKKK